MQIHQDYMGIAMEEAKKAFEAGEVPVGALIVHENKILAAAFNKKETHNDSTAHAEMLLISEASKILNNWRLTDCTIYVTLEPCPMCAGAIIQSRVSTLVFGAKNFVYGSFGTVLALQEHYPDARNLEIIGGILEKEAGELLKSFFRKNKPGIPGNNS
jgi:tRNA(adenine34) deaminase